MTSIMSAPISNQLLLYFYFFIASIDNVLILLIACFSIDVDILSPFQFNLFLFLMSFIFFGVTSFPSGSITFTCSNWSLKEFLMFFKYSFLSCCCSSCSSLDKEEDLAFLANSLILFNFSFDNIFHTSSLLYSTFYK